MEQQRAYRNERRSTPNADQATTGPEGSTHTIEAFITGTPYPKVKTMGRLAAPAEWTAEVVSQTRELPRVTGACELEAEFVLPPNKFTSGNPYGVDIDNLLKRLLDALSTTVFRDAPKNDAAITSLIARKRLASGSESTGVRISIRPADFQSTREEDHP